MILLAVYLLVWFFVIAGYLYRHPELSGLAKVDADTGEGYSVRPQGCLLAITAYVGGLVFLVPLFSLIGIVINLGKGPAGATFAKMLGAYLLGLVVVSAFVQV